MSVNLDPKISIVNPLPKITENSIDDGGNNQKQLLCGDNKHKNTKSKRKVDRYLEFMASLQRP